VKKKKHENPEDTGAAIKGDIGAEGVKDQKGRTSGAKWDWTGLWAAEVIGGV